MAKRKSKFPPNAKIRRLEAKIVEMEIEKNKLKAIIAKSHPLFDIEEVPIMLRKQAY